MMSFLKRHLVILRFSPLLSVIYWTLNFFEIDVVEKDKAYDPPIGSVRTKFDLYAFDPKNRVIVDMQRFSDHYHRWLHYHCAALLAQAVKSKNYSP